MAHFLFFLLAIVCVGAVVAMIISRDQAYSALYLILAFVSVAGLFGLLDAPFLAVIQIIVYAGAIMVLFLFVIMMINLREGIPPERKRWIAGLSFVIAGVLIIELGLALKGFLSPGHTAVAGSPGSPTDLGRLLFTKYLYPFEITSVLIIAALVGAMILVKKRDAGEEQD